MSEDTPTPAAAATPAVLPLTQEEIETLEARHTVSGLEWEGGGPWCNVRAGADRERWPCTLVRLIATWKAARSQAAHWKRMYAKEEDKAGGWMDKAIVNGATIRSLTEQRDAAVAQRDAAEKLAAFRLDTIHDLDGALAQLRPALSVALADLAEFARQTREAQVAMMAAIADREQERQRADRAEQDRDQTLAEFMALAGQPNHEAEDLAHALIAERARGERLVYRVANVQTGDVVAAFADATEGEAFLALPEYAERYGFIEVLAAPSSPAAEPADQTAARSPGE